MTKILQIKKEKKIPTFLLENFLITFMPVLCGTLEIITASTTFYTHLEAEGHGHRLLAVDRGHRGCEVNVEGHADPRAHLQTCHAAAVPAERGLHGEAQGLRRGLRRGLGPPHRPAHAGGALRPPRPANTSGGDASVAAVA